MTKKNYQMFADIIKIVRQDVYKGYKWDASLIDLLANYFEQDDPNFDRGRWYSELSTTAPVPFDEQGERMTAMVFEDNPARLAHTLNTWLAAHPNIQIHHVVQSATVDVDNYSWAILTIFYEEMVSA